MKIVFFGASNYVLPIVESLNKNFELTMVLTTEKGQNESVIKFCNENKIPYKSVDSKEGVKEGVLNHKANLGVVADFGIIISKEVLNAFTYGIINVHPSLLPKYRGPTPVQTTLLEGETKTGVSIIKLDENVDHGPILAQEEEIIGPEDSTQTLLQILFQKGAQMLPPTINSFVKGDLEIKEQNHADATFTQMLKKDDGYINLITLPQKDRFNNMVRAFYPWPGVWTKAVLSKDASEKIIKFLPNQKIQVEGKKEMSYKDFLNGYPTANSLLKKFLENV